MDRRQSSRTALVDGTKTTIRNAENDEHVSELIDINNGGARLIANKKIPTGSIISLSLENTHSKGTPCFIDAKIMWRSTQIKKTPKSNGSTWWEYGLLFYQASTESQELIKELFPQTNSIKERREQVRRGGAFHPISANKRKVERRHGNEFKIRVNRICKSFDKWTTYHTYLRASEEINYPTASVNGKKKIMLGSNSYLGLSTHPLVKEAAIKAIEKFGVGSGGVPVLSGTTILHDELCESLAKFKGTESAILYPSGYVANLTSLSTFFGEDDTIFCDERNHASIIDGARMSKAKLRFFKHNDMDDLEKKLNQCELAETKLIVVDGVYSMDGDICDLKSIHSLAAKHNALTMVDDAHSTGVIGKTGRGTAEHFNLTGKIDLTTVTLSKSIGCIGGAICGSKALIKFLIHLSRSFIFSTSLPPPICAGAIAAIKLIQTDPSIVANLRRNIAHLKNGLITLGFSVAPTDSAIIPIIIGDEMLTYKITRLLDDEGVFVNAVSRPAVARELSRLRVSPNAMHTIDDLDICLKAFKKVGAATGLI